MINRRFAMDHPDRCEGLVILNSPHERSPEAQRLVEERAAATGAGRPAATIAETLERWFTPGFRASNVKTVDWVRDTVLSNDPDNYTKHRQVLASGVVELIRPEPPIAQPTLVMTCENDTGSTPAMSRGIGAEIDGAEDHRPAPATSWPAGGAAAFPRPDPQVSWPYLSEGLNHDKLTGGQAAVEALKAEKVGHVFGLIGSATMEMFDALYDASEIQLIGVHDERTGTHMADGYARMSGQAGVVLAGQNGPGATNLVTGLGQAKAAYSPVVSIAGSLASSHVYRDAFQEVDQQALFTPITEDLDRDQRRSRARDGARGVPRGDDPRRGPVQLNLPRDVLSAQAEFDAFQTPKPIAA
ncbi:MAG: thiamine pyrophosphate-binding protein [Paracoccaceae bacterium]